jgi:hypothetical protein
MFKRQAYHTKCVDDQQRSFEYGALMGYYTTGEPCATACVKGTTVSELKGCNASDRPPLSALVGYEYDCDLGTCYCLYNHGTLSDKYSRCFDSMNRSGQGYIDNDSYYLHTATVKDRTCYNLSTQPADPGNRVATLIPTATPVPPPGGICTRSPDYGCYKSGRPACCNSGYTCPSFMTLCDNAGAGTGGSSPCTWSPDYGCWPSTNGWPPCCDKDGGDFVNCPKTEDLKKYQPCEPTPSPTRNVNVSVLFHALKMILFFVRLTLPLLYVINIYSLLASQLASQLAR